MIAELIPAWTADAIHLRMLKEILCGYHEPKAKADQVRACLVFRKVAVAKPSFSPSTPPKRDYWDRASGVLAARGGVHWPA